MKKRIGWIDSLRVFGAAAVVQYHVIANWSSNFVGGGGY